LVPAPCNLNVRDVVSQTGDVDLKAQLSILDAVDVENPDDPFSSDDENVTLTKPKANVLGNNVTLRASFGTIGEFGNDFDVNTAYSVLNGQPGTENVVSGKLWLFASGDIGEPFNAISTSVGSIEAKTVSGSTWVVNDGALTEGGVVDSGYPGLSGGGSAEVTAESPYTVIEDAVFVEEITFTAADSAGAGDDLTVTSDCVVQSNNSYVELRAGDNLIIEDGATVEAATEVRLYSDYGNADSDVGSTINVVGTLTAARVIISGEAENDTISISGSITAADRIEIYGGGGEDFILLTGILIAPEIRIYGETADDFITIDINDPTDTLAGHVQVFGGGGDDEIMVIGAEGPGSPLVIYGDFFQDGSQYGISSGTPGDDIIDASESSLSVAIYGGPGNDNIKGSQAGDHIAGGSGNDTIYGEAGMDHIYGDSGFNTKPETLELEVVTVNSSSNPSSDNLTAGADEIHGGDEDDIIFGDHGVIEQTAGTIRVLTTGNVENIYAVEPENGAMDTIHGDKGDDIIMGGGAADTIHGGAHIDLIFGDQGAVEDASGDNWVVTYDDQTPPWYEGYSYTSTQTENADAGTADTIYGDDGGDYILGQQGQDVIFGGSGDDDIYGGHNVAGGHDTGDIIDGGTGNDVIVGDNASIQRTGGALNPRMRVLQGDMI